MSFYLKVVKTAETSVASFVFGQEPHINVMVRCPNTFGNTACLKFKCGKFVVSSLFGAVDILYTRLC